VTKRQVAKGTPEKSPRERKFRGMTPRSRTAKISSTERFKAALNALSLRKKERESDTLEPLLAQLKKRNKRERDIRGVIVFAR